MYTRFSTVNIETSYLSLRSFKTEQKKKEEKSQFPCLNTQYSLWGAARMKGQTVTASGTVGAGGGTDVPWIAQGHHVL